jgi:chromosome segregation ATPase
MTDPSAIETATRRLAMALDALEAAVERRREADHNEERLVAQLHALSSDRSRLASELDAAMAHAKQLETANREIARRLDIAIGGVRAVIEANDR